MGVRDWFRRRRDADPSLARPAEPVADGPEAFADELRRLFPDAQISAPDDTIGAGELGSSGSVSTLERLAQLHADGALTDEEFAAAKARFLGG